MTFTWIGLLNASTILQPLAWCTHKLLSLSHQQWEKNFKCKVALSTHTQSQISIKWFFEAELGAWSMNAVIPRNKFLIFFTVVQTVSTPVCAVEITKVQKTDQINGELYSLLTPCHIWTKYLILSWIILNQWLFCQPVENIWSVGYWPFYSRVYQIS